MISFSAFVDELVKVARVHQAVKQYRRYMQLREGPGFAHATRAPAAGEILESGKILPGHNNYLGRGAYFTRGPSSEAYGPIQFVTSKRRGLGEGLKQVTKGTEKDVAPPKNWYRTEDTPFNIKRKDAIMFDPMSTLSDEAMGKLRRRAQEKGLRVIGQEAFRAGYFGKHLSDKAKKNLIKEYKMGMKRSSG